ncbi:MAG: NAD(+)/NADH kinase [Thermoproteus sp. AZ2]|uniref:NAD(+)/NADH kinase n=1 Tax=Thermoproteus sp. AZ2 TaxID=1609232 RepID=A0ACC6V1S6_9CREN|nr:MAG: ATP-NAD kinase [Thermoproteus sp. AZ2]
MISIVYRPDLEAYAKRLSALIGAEPLSCSKRPDLTVVVGGDGTLLSAIHTHPCVLDSVVLHVGGGKINFFSAIRVGEAPLEEIARRITSGDFRVIELPTIDAGCTAVNEVVVRNADYKKLLSFKLYGDSLSIDGRADGVIISTPQGSTGYALSAMAPIVDFRINAFIIAFIAPFTLYLRPLIVPPGELWVEAFQDAVLVCDGYEELRDRKFLIRPGARRLKMAVFGDFDYGERVAARLIAR